MATSLPAFGSIPVRNPDAASQQGTRPGESCACVISGFAPKISFLNQGIRKVGECVVGKGAWGSRLCALLGFFAILQPCIAAPLPEPARSEVLALLARLESSGCQFNRNGAWYPGPEARAHLQRKLDYLEKNATPKSAEDFIDLAATSSSVSGRPYLVRCAGAASEPSSVWLRRELLELRSATAK